MTLLETPKLSPRQLEVYNAIQDNRRRWVGLIFLMIVFSIGFIAFLVALFIDLEQVSTRVLGGVTALLGFHMRRAYQHIYPASGEKPWYVQLATALFGKGTAE